MKKSFKSPGIRPPAFRPSISKTPKSPGPSLGTRYRNYRSGRGGCGGLIGFIVALVICLACLAVLVIGYFLVSQGYITIPGVSF
jgi:hypothetical protein